MKRHALLVGVTVSSLMRLFGPEPFISYGIRLADMVYFYGRTRRTEFKQSFHTKM